MLVSGSTRIELFDDVAEPMRRSSPGLSMPFWLAMMTLLVGSFAAPGASIPGLGFTMVPGSSDLHRAALQGDVRMVQGLLAAGADPRGTNEVGATALHYGAGDPEIVEILVGAGADANATSLAGTTPLHAAAARPNADAAIRRLLNLGSRIDTTRPTPPFGDVTALTISVLAGNERGARLLLDAGASPGGTNGFSPVAAAALTGRGKILQKLLARGGAVNFDDGFAGHALNSSLYMGHPEIARFLIRKGADAHQASSFGERVPPIVWSAYNESGDVAIARLLAEHGVDINERTSAGHTALDWALRRGETELTAFLRSAGGVSTPAITKLKPLPQNRIPSDGLARLRAVHQAAQKAVVLLQQSSDAFLRNGFVRESACVSCHHQTLPAIAFGRARESGIEVDEGALARQLKSQVASWERNQNRAFEMIEPVPDSAYNLGYGLAGMHALRYPPDALTSTMVWYLAETQLPDGSWGSIDRRPPLEESRMVGTSLAVKALQLYPQALDAGILRGRVVRARDWFRRQSPTTVTDRAFRLLGLHWCEEKASRLGFASKELVGQQRADGGWAALPGLESDAWATGLTLFALLESRTLMANSVTYQRGVDFLLRTQFEDGSWWVRSRTWPFQPHFDSRFPHGKDQWISAAATAWASLALINSLPPIDSQRSIPTADLLYSRLEEPEPDEVPLISHSGTRVTGEPKLEFQRDIRPLLERSCHDCHSGENPKGKFRVGDVADLRKGGQSGEPAIVGNRPESSQLLRLVSDQIEDFEMPPRHSRTKYPPLSPGEIGRVREWIYQGAQ